MVPAQDSTPRVFDLWIDESDTLTREILDREAERAAGQSEAPPDELLEVWRAAVSQLAPRPVAIPCAKKLAWACTLLHQFPRETDEEGRVVSTREDYASVSPLIQVIVGPSLTGLSEKARAIVELFQELARGVSVRAPGRIRSRSRGRIAKRPDVHPQPPDP